MCQTKMHLHVRLKGHYTCQTKGVFTHVRLKGHYTCQTKGACIHVRLIGHLQMSD